MAGHAHPIIQLLKNDPRYPLEAYQFVRESLAYAQKSFHLEDEDELLDDDLSDDLDDDLDDDDDDDDDDDLSDDFSGEFADELPGGYAGDFSSGASGGLSSDSSNEFSEELEEELSGIRRERHVKGQQLCESIRDYALDQYGYMAKTVLNNWGITTTSDFGEIVYNLIDIGLMKKSEDDRREDFDNVYDFDDAFRRQFRISVSE